MLSSSEAAKGPLHSTSISIDRYSYLHSSAHRLSRSVPDGPPCRLNAGHRCPRAIATGIAELHRRQCPRSCYMSSFQSVPRGHTSPYPSNCRSRGTHVPILQLPVDSHQNFPRNPRGDQYWQGSPCVVQSPASNGPKQKVKWNLA